MLFFSVLKQCKIDKNHELISSKPGVVIGKIEKYYEIGIASHYMDYLYTVDFKVFRNKVIPKKLFKNCEDDQKCFGKPIYVRYYLDDPNISEPIYDSIPEW